MKKFAALLATLLLAAGICFASDPVEGYWVSFDEKTNEATASWHIWVENNTVVGEIIKVPNQDDSTKATAGAGKTYKDFYNGQDVGTLQVVGTKWIWGCQKSSEGKWKGGNIIDAGSGSKYTCTITFHAADGKKYTVDTLEMRGSIGPIGRSQYWQKSTESEAKNI